MSSKSTRGELIEKTLQVRRCAAVVKGGRRFSFTALVVVGDGNGKVGCGYAKANEVPPAVDKANKDGAHNMVTIPRFGKTIPHTTQGKYGASSVVLVPASPGTGVIAGSSVRAVCEAAGIQDILTKAYGSTNPANLAKATINALLALRTKQDTERFRGVSIS